MRDLSKWEPGDPIYRGAGVAVIMDMFELKDDEDTAWGATAHWTPDDGWCE